MLVRYVYGVATYENAPLRYVVFVLELSPAAVLGERTTLDQIHDALKSVLPVREDGDQLTPGLVGLVRTPGARFVSAQKDRAVAVTPDRIVIDSTQYSTFGEFADFVGRVLSTVAALAPGRACRRLGLRYVDEIRIPKALPGNVEQWVAWVNGDLLSAALAHTAVGPREISGVID